MKLLSLVLWTLTVRPSKYVERVYHQKQLDRGLPFPHDQVSALIRQHGAPTPTVTAETVRLIVAQRSKGVNSFDRLHIDMLLDPGPLLHEAIAKATNRLLQRGAIDESQDKAFTMLGEAGMNGTVQKQATVEALSQLKFTLLWKKPGEAFPGAGRAILSFPAMGGFIDGLNGPIRRTHTMLTGILAPSQLSCLKQSCYSPIKPSTTQDSIVIPSQFQIPHPYRNQRLFKSTGPESF